MDACQNAAPAILASRGLHGLQISFDDLETSPERLKPDCGESAYGTTEVVPSRPVVEEKRWWVPAIWHELGKVRAAEKTPHMVHVEVDELFACVEQVLNPKLWEKPVLVGHGVVASASTEAKFHGVKTGMSLIDAVRLCPKAIVVPGQYEHYAEFAERVRRILETYTPVVQTAARNDFYLDFAGSGRLYADFEGTLRRLQAEVLGRTGLNVSVGAGRTKVVASIASRLAGPHGVRIVVPGTEETVLAPLPVDRLYGIGHAHAVALAEQGVTMIGALRRIPGPVLAAAFGDENGKQIWTAARGLDERKSSLPSACVLRETNIEVGTIDREVLGGLLEYLSERIAAVLREQGKQAGSIGVRVRYVDQSSAQQTIRLVRSTNDECELRLAARELFARVVARGLAVGQVGVSVANLADGPRDERLHREADRGCSANRKMSRTGGGYGWDAVLQSS